jgi:hypothetical protein
MRTSTVKRFGGFNTASFCIETRIGSAADINAIALPEALKSSWEKESAVSLLGW